MMKKWTALLTALVLLCAAAGAWAESTEGIPDLYDVYEVTESGKNWVCSAIPVADGVTITSAAGLPDNPDKLEIWDGNTLREVAVMMKTGQGTVAVLLHETEEKAQGIPAFPFLEAARSVQADDLLVRSGDWMQSRINRAVYDLSVTKWKNREAMLLTLSGDTAPGSPVITWDGKLAGVIISEYAEGQNRYLALTIPSINACLQEADALLNGPETGTAPEGYKTTVNGNVVVFDWSEVQLPEVGEGEKLYHIVADMASSYLTFMEIEHNQKTLRMVLTPGRTYVAGLAVFAKQPDSLPDQYAVITLPEAEPMTDHSFRQLTFALGELPKGATSDTMPTVVTDVTEELLRSDRCCIYSVSSYEVEKEISGLSLLIAMTAPDGNNYRYESSWYYLPEYNEKDEWYVTMKDSGLLDMMDENIPAGTYDVSMYINGKLAASFSFTLTK